MSGVTDHVEAVALAYCTDQPLRLTLDIAAVEDLDEVVSKRRAGVSATAKDLADDDVLAKSQVTELASVLAWGLVMARD